MRRTYLNIAAFLVLSSVLIGWSTANYLPLGIFEDPRIVTAEFAESPGLLRGYEVTYLGRAVGRIEGVRLVAGHSEVDLAIDDGVDLPREVIAAARRRSAIGEPYVDLSPVPGTDADGGARLADGDRIPPERTTSPIQYGELFRSLDTLVRGLDREALATVVREASTAVDGRGDDIRRIVVGADALARGAAANGAEIEAMIDDLGSLASVLAAHRDSIGSSITSLKELASSLDDVRPALRELLDELPSSLGLLNRIVAASDDALVCTIDGLSVLQVVLDDESLLATAQLLQRSAAFADVVQLVRDPDDGIFNLLISVNSGEPTVVQYPEPAPIPAAPETPPCPTHDVTVEADPLASVARPGPGGTPPRPDGSESDPPDADVPGSGDVASGSSDTRAAEPAAVRLAKQVGPWLLLASVVAALIWFLLARRTERES